MILQKIIFFHVMRNPNCALLVLSYPLTVPFNYLGKKKKKKKVTLCLLLKMNLGIKPFYVTTSFSILVFNYSNNWLGFLTEGGLGVLLGNKRRFIEIQVFYLENWQAAKNDKNNKKPLPPN